MHRFFADMARDEPSAPKNVKRGTNIVNLWQIGGDQDDPRTGFQQFGEKFVNFDFGANVDTDGRFVENKEAGTMVQPFSDHDLLLVTAGKTRGGSVAGSCFNLHIPDLFIRCGLLSHRVDDDPGRQTLVDRKVDIEPNPHVEAEPLIAPAFRYQSDT